MRLSSSFAQQSADDTKACIVLASKAQGYDHETIATALRFLARTFMQHDGAGQLQRLRETSYHNFSFFGRKGARSDDNSSGTQDPNDSDRSSVSTQANNQDHDIVNDLKEIEISEQEIDSDTGDRDLTAQHQHQPDEPELRVNAISLVVSFVKHCFDEHRLISQASVFL